MIRDMIMEEEYIILNNMATGGPWTWAQRGKENVKSCLDIAIASRNLLPYVKSVTIDDNKQFTRVLEMTHTNEVQEIKI